MKKETIIAILVTWALTTGLIFWLISTVQEYKIIKRPPVNNISDKYDSECTGTETAGRCTDKCPAGSYLVGFKSKDAGYICKLEPTGCPYGDSIPLGPNCDKHQPQELQPALMQFEGK
jgi:hypothetical protein